MSGDKFVYLSTASLKKVSEWVDRNEDNPICILYMNACGLIAELKEQEPFEQHYLTLKKVSELNSKKCSNLYEESRHIYYELDKCVFRQRDNVGRIILEIIKRDGNDLHQTQIPRHPRGSAR